MNAPQHPGDVVCLVVRFGNNNKRQKCPYCLRFFKGLTCRCGITYEHVTGDDYRVMSLSA